MEVHLSGSNDIVYQQRNRNGRPLSAFFNIRSPLGYALTKVLKTI